MERITFAATASVKGHTLEGVAHAFGKRTLVGNRYIEFAAGAFDAAMARDDTCAFLNHDTGKLLGRKSNGTVRLSAEQDGLHYAIDLPDTSYSRDLETLIERGDMTSMSFGVIPGKYQLAKAPDGKQVQIHTSVNSLFDISPVSLPAFEGTSISLHSLALEGETVRSQTIKARHRARKG
jgi:HK97 family phage prohead protease